MSAAARLSIGLAALIAIVASGWFLSTGRGLTMVRVGGAHNACACTRRIEP